MHSGDLHPLYIDVFDNSLSRKWLAALNHVLSSNLLLEKSYCFLGFPDYERDITLILNQINKAISVINKSLPYQIEELYHWENSVHFINNTNGYKINQEKFNRLHKYFEELQGSNGKVSHLYEQADWYTRYHIRQLNLLCHEFESLVLSINKRQTAPEWQRPSQLMCWLNAPRFTLSEEDFELFGVETIARPLGGVVVGVNKAVGKTHWEVFCDEGRNIDELTTSALINQTVAAADFDIEWGNNPGEYQFMKDKLSEFTQWLLHNGFDANDKSLTLGHPQVGQVNLDKSFGTKVHWKIWQQLSSHLDVYEISTSDAVATYDYTWQDRDFILRYKPYLDR